ncbi:antimicrobial response protein [Lithospermum erythrorhizon]|uniref:Antimicrobial response protein n=1 Tax=Lithospermum erythrorhizon TaxID=34254 RepID=A0AAV3R9X4_LITER
MAATAARIVATEPVKNFFRIIEHYILYAWNYKRNIRGLEEEIVKINHRRETIERDVPTAINNAKDIRPDVEGWVRTSQEYEREGGDLLERTNDGKSSFLCCNVPNVCFRYSVSKEASERTMDMIRHLGQSNFVGVGQPKQPGQLPFLSRGEFYEFESRMVVEKEVLHALEDESIFEIGICGMPGSGKTILAKRIAEEVKSSNKRLFDEVAMAVVSQDANINKIQDDLASRLGLSDIEMRTNVVVRAELLYNRLMGNEGKRTLIILDDLWEELDLHKVGIPDPSICKGLKILLTSRLHSICRLMKVQKIFEVKILSEEEAWALFKLSARISDQDISPEAKEVAEECAGLPLAIVVIGKCLIGKQQYAFTDMLRRLRDTSEGFPDKVYKSIKLSYDNLDNDEQRSLLLICSLFPEDHEILVDYLVIYQMGLSGTFASMKEIEDRVNVIVDELKDCHLLLVGEEEGYVKLHDVVRDVCLSVANKENQNYMVMHGGLNEWPENCELCTCISLTVNNLEKSPPALNYPKLRLLRLDFENERADEVDISRLSIRGMKELRVLEVHKILSFPFFTLQYLTNLRTLSFEDCSIEGDMSGIGSLAALRVLSFFRSQVTMIPEEISQLTNLKSLDMRFYNMGGSEHILPGTLSRLKNLEELYLGVYREGVEMEIHREKIKEVSLLTKLHTVQYSTNSGQCLKTLLDNLNVQKLISFDFSNERDMYFNKILCNSLKLVNFDMGYLPAGWGLLGLLKKLSIEDAQNFEGWFRSELLVGSLIKLQEASLSEVDVKENLWGSLQFPSLCKLKILNISLCHDVESIFLNSTIKLLCQLLKLSVKYCKKLERLVTISHQDGIESSEEVIVFPELQELILISLSNFSSIGPDHKTCQVLFPKLKNIDISDIQLEQLRFSLPELRCMTVSYCDKLSAIANYKLIEGLPNLEQLIVNSCSSLEFIFDFEEINTTTRSDQGEIRLLGQLKKLSLHNLPMLKHLTRMLLQRESQQEIVPSAEETPHQTPSKPRVVKHLSSCLNGSMFNRPRPKPVITLTSPPKQICVFQDLMSLEVEGCDGLRYILTPTIVNMLVSLENLYLKGNRLMEAIIGCEEDEASHRDAIIEGKILLPKLKLINIDSLSRLRMFSCYPNHHLDLPSLANLRFSNCPNMSRVCYGEMTATELTSVLYNVDSERSDKGVPLDIFLNSWLKDCESRIVCLNCRYEEKSTCNHLHEPPFPSDAGSLSSSISLGFSFIARDKKCFIGAIFVLVRNNQ